MDGQIAGLIARIHGLEAELEAAFAKRRLALAYTVKDRVVHMEEAVLKRHRALQSHLASYVLGARPQR